MTSNPQDEMRQMPCTALEEFDRFCRFIDGFHDGGYVENDFMSKKIQKQIRAAIKSDIPRAVSGGEALEALDRLNEYAFGDEDDRKDYETVKQALTRQPVETKPVEQEEFIEKTGYVDIYDKIIASGFIITRKD